MLEGIVGGNSMKIFQFCMRMLSKFLPLWIVLLSIISYVFPNTFRSIRSFTGIGLGTIFLLMGMSLSSQSILSVLKKPKNALIGVALKWIITVGITIVIAFLFFQAEPEIAAGVILAGTVPSGTSANLYTFIAGGEVALSITMATMDTIISPLLTPTLVQVSAGKFIEIAFLPLFFNIIYIVFIPLFVGLFLQWKWYDKVKYVQPYTSFISTIALFIVVLSVISGAQQSLHQHIKLLPLIFVAVFFQVSIPMIAGYWIARYFNIAEPSRRSILFHVGICNTALSSTLAMQHISSVAAVPAVANMVVNLTIGALVANMLSYRDKTEVSARRSD